MVPTGSSWTSRKTLTASVVIEHDRDFMRVAGAHLEVWQATGADLADLDVGSVFGPEYSDQRVPELREVLQLAKDQVGCSSN